MVHLNKNGVVCLLALALTVTMMIACGEGEELHKVGGSPGGWTQGINFTQWSSQERFYVGDWLYFVFDKRYYNVLEVNETSYKDCNDQGFMKNITKGGRDVYLLTEARPYYFLSGGGYCWNGMKLFILVQQIPSIATPAPPPSSNNGPGVKCLFTFLLLFMSLVVLII